MPITSQSPQWSEPLPSDRRQFLPGPKNRHRPLQAVTYGDYFLAARDFLNQKLDILLQRAIKTSGLDAAHAAGRVEKIGIHLVKHGAFYHPARIVLHGTGVLPTMVLNVAVSPTGRDIIAREYHSLERLYTEFNLDRIPEVYAFGHGRTPQKGDLDMFAGQWLSGFCEFHPGTGGQSGCRKWFVWDEDSRWTLSDDQICAVYRQAMFILTSFYNPLTFEAVLDWHHAAGDFVVKQGARGIQVRLITVRRYAPMLDLTPGEVDSQAVLDGLVVFLLNTSMRMRLDRLDGVGEPVWAADRVVGAIWRGFRQGLAQMAARWQLPDGFDRAVVRYLAGHGTDDLLQVGHAILARHAGAPDDAGLMTEQLAGHVRLLAGRITDE